jgi:hypothetical protein
VTKLAEGLYKVELAGHLTLNGITRIQIVACQVTVGPTACGPPAT